MTNNKVFTGGGRNSSLELMRIVAMLLIVAHHYSQRALKYADVDYSSFNLSTLFLQTVGFGGKMAINAFVILSAYFLCKQTLNWIKVLKLYLEILFYSLVGYLFLHLTGIQPLTPTLLIDMVTRPLSSIENGFIGSFMVFYLQVPFLTHFVNNISQKSLQYLILLLTNVYSILPTFYLVQFNCNYVFWFTYLFLVASHMRLYPSRATESPKTSSFLFFGSLFLIFSWMFVCNYFGYAQFSNWFSMDSNKALALTSGVGMFLWFKNISVKNNRIINWIAISSFAVLLIHDHSKGMKTLLWTNIFHNDSYYGSPLIIVNCVVAVVSVFIVCILIDKIRIHLLEKPLLSALTDKYKTLNNTLFENIDK